MADFLLSVGVDVELSYEQMKKDISNLVSDLNKTPPKIKVAFDIDQKAVESLRNQITAIDKQLGSASTNTSSGSTHRKATAEIADIANEARRAADTQAAASKKAANAEKEHETSLRQVLNTYRELLAAMRTNQNAQVASTYSELVKQADLFGSALEIAEDKAISIDAALKQVGLDSSTAIENAKTALAAFRVEMEQTGSSGTINMSQMYSVIAQMQNLLNSNANAANLSSYTVLQEQVRLFTNALQLASSGSISLSEALKQVGLDGSTAISDARTAMSAFRAELSGATLEEVKLTKDSEQYNVALNKINTLLAAVRNNTEKWTAAKKGSSSADYETYSQQAGALEKLASKLASGTLTTKQFNKEYSKIKATINSAATAIKAAGEDTQTWAERIKNLSEKFSTWFSITQVIMGAYRVVRKMVSAVVELDTAMTELKKVTDETDSTYERFLVNAATRAKQLGATLSDTVTATADFARLGYGIEDAEKLADAAIIYKNVGDGIKDISEASESIIATMQAYSDEINPEDVMLIVDKFNEVGNKYAISSEGVGEALLRSAAAMNAANNSLDETIALATAANTIVQDPEKVGTTLKTVSMYLRAAKTEMEEAGEATDGMATSVSELRKDILALTNNKVDIQIDEDTFKSTYQILKELSAEWDNLTDITKANILEMVGGKRNSNVVAALLDNFTVAENALETSANAAGSALAENEKYLDSIQGRISIFKASFEEFSNNLISSGIVKLFVSAGTALMNALNTLVKIHALLPTIVGTLTIIKGISLSKTIAESSAKVATLSASLIAEKSATDMLASSVAALTLQEKQRLALNIQNAVASGQITAQEGAQILSTLGLATAEGTLTVANKTLGASFKSLMASIPVWGWIALAISVVIEGVIALTSWLDKSSESIADLDSEISQLTNTAKSIANEFSQLKSSADEVIPRFVELAKGVDSLGRNTSLTDEEYAEFLSLNNKIAEMFPELNLGMDENGNAMVALSYSADTLRESLEALLEAQRQEANQKIAENMPELLEDIKKYEDATNETIDEIQGNINKIKSGSFTRSTFGDQYSAFSDAKNIEEFYDYVEYLTNKGIEVTTNVENVIGTTGMTYTATWDAAASQATNAVAGLEKEIDNLESKIESKWRSINPTVSAWLQSDFLYNDMNDQMQSIAKTMISALNFNDLGLIGKNGEETSKNIQSYITKYVINPLYSASPEVQLAFQNLFSELKSGEITSDEFAEKMKDAFNSLISSMDTSEVDSFKSAFVNGFNAIGVAGGDFETVVDNIIASWGSLPDSAGTASTSLSDLADSLSKLKDSYDILATAEEEMASGGLSADTIKELADETDNYLDYLYEENGVVKLNTDAWKEYANAKMEGNIRAIEAEISALESEKVSLEEQNEALQNAKVYADDFIGAIEPGAYRQSEYTAAVEANTSAMNENAAAIEANQAKLGIYKTLYGEIATSLDAYSATLNNFSNIANAITSVSNALTTVANLQETVANGFTISLEKALEFAKVYPEILNNATVAADGQISLNEGVVNAFISGKEAELKAQIDAKVAELEADKSVLTAKMEFSKAQLELAKSVGTGEGQISKEVAEYRVNAGNAVAQALIAAGIDEATAYQLACAAMAQNSEEFNRVAAEVCTDVQGNFNQAAYDAAQSIYKNMQNSKLSIASVAEQAHQAALAIAGIGSGKVQGSSSVNGGGAGGSSGSKGNVTVSSGSFKGTSYSYESKTIALEDFISDLELDISNYTQAISQIDGQIAALKALRNTSLNKFSTSNKKASSGSKTSKELASQAKDKDVDWIKIRIERLQSAIDKLKNVASGAYNTIGEKLSASFKQIEKINEEISIQQEMYKAYMSYANSVGLSESLAKKVREGAIEISKYDSDTQELIESYKKWYEAALDCSDAVTTLHDDLAALYVDIFNNTKQDFEDQISLLEHTQKEYQHELDIIDELSHLGGEKYYKLLQSYEKEHIELLEQELDELQKKFDAAMASGEIEKYSEAWYDSKIAINSVKEAIADANTELIRHTNNLRNASKERFGFAENRVSQLTQEADFLIGLFDEDGLTDDKGQLTDKGWSVAGLHAQNYDTYMLQADDYAKEMLKVNKELAKDPANTELIERREELLKLQQDSIKSAADEKSAIIDLVKNGIEKELSSLQKLIDTYNESLDSAKNLHDYQKNVTEKAAEIANIQKQMAAYANDSSEEARSKIQKLEVSLKDAREDLQETEYDRYISEQKQLLDDLYAEYEETINSRLDNVDGLLSEIFDAVNGNAGTIDSAIRETAAEFGYTLTASMAQLWSEGAQGRDVISKYGQEISDKFTALNTVVADLYTLAYEKGDIDRNGSVDVSDARLALRYAVSLETPDAKSLRLADLNGDGVITVGEAREILNKAIGKTYATGGLADYTGLAKVDGSKQKPELVLNQNDTQNFLSLRDYLRKISAKPISIENGLNIQNDIITPIINEMTDVSRIIRDVNIPANMNAIGDINIQIERVQDYNDFITQLQHDPKAERMIQAMTLGQATGKGSLSKYGVSWR